MEGEQPGVDPVSPAGNDPSGQGTPPAPNGSEPDNNAGGGNGEQSVPYSRFHEVNEKAKKAEEEAAQLRQQLEERDTTPDPEEDEDEVDPNVENLIEKVLSRRGYVKKSDLDAREGARQYVEDVKELTDKYAKSSVPFVAEDVRNFAKDNNINITSKASLEAAYKTMNYDKLVEAAQNAAITEFKEGKNFQGEKPNGNGGKEPEQQPAVRGVKNRIHAAIQRQRTA